jgi:predicted RNA-binding Zn ribbon-like protein
MAVMTGIEETGSKPAPGRLALVQAFVNTRDLETGSDALAGPPELESWLKGHDLLPGGDVGRKDLERAVAFREDLRAMLLANNGVPASAEAVDRLNELARSCALTVRFDAEGGISLETESSGVDGAIARLLGIVLESIEHQTWTRLKACPGDACQWAFYDRSRNSSGTWCTMSVCGNRAKARAYRKRAKKT